MTDLLRDFQFSIRSLLKSPAFLLISVASLALGIGANGAVFSMLNGMLFRPLPVKDADRLVRLSTKLSDVPYFMEVGYPNFRDLRESNESLEDMIAWAPGMPGLATASFATKALGAIVTSNYFEFFGIEPGLGRFFTGGDDEAQGSQPYVVLGHSYWTSHFGADRGVIGQTVRLNNNPFEIIGVTSEEFHGGEVIVDLQFYVPMSMLEQAGGGDREGRGGTNFRTLGRLKPGVTVSRAQAEMDLLVAGLAAQHPSQLKGASIKVIPELESRPEPSMHGFMPRIAAMFLAMVGLVLLIACANIANLALARGLGRHRELSVRVALGASRWRVVRQLMTESFVVALLGGAAGLIVAGWASSVLESIRPPTDLPFVFDYSLDERVLLFNAALTLLTVLLFGLMPAYQASKADVHGAMKDGGQRSGDSRGGNRIRSILVVSEFALATLLLVVAGLFLRSLDHAKEVFLGMRPENILLATISPRGAGYEADAGQRFLETVLDEASNIPGVMGVSFSRHMPFAYSNSGISMYPEGRPPNPDEPLKSALYSTVSSDYFKTVRTPILRGRGFDASDNADAPKVIIVNEKFAETFWPGEDALGKRMMRDRDPGGEWYEIVGIVPTGKYTFLGEPDLDYAFVPWKQNPQTEMTFQLRTAGDPASLGPGFRALVRSIDSAVPVSDVYPFADFVYDGKGLIHVRLAAMLMGSFAVIGLTLAAIGVFGSLSYFVSRHRREIGVRMAVGADRTSVVRLVLSSGFKLAGTGLALGLIATVAISKLVGAMLVDVSPTDPLTYAIVASFLILVAFLSCYLPASRAAGLDPMRVLRED